MPTPPGAHYVADYVCDHQARTLVQCIDGEPWRTDLKRRVQHYGYRYDYRARQIAKVDHLGAPPPWLSDIRSRLVADGWFDRQPDQVIVNEYLPGQGIAPHVDCRPCFGDAIASLTLISGCEMAFQNLSSSARVAVFLAPRALLILTGEARHCWTHGIAARKSDHADGNRIWRGRRISLTFRQVRLAQ
ncbi:MAG: alpha-ketoglutarate-dependent dioxygenase AlkB [Neomegalonema sp.]|nr:alpha-ketoglutarate-dependent dioxygenase AlkB [Neomegalonema sp.]